MTTPALSFRSGYTTHVLILVSLPGIFTSTHSPCRGEAFSLSPAVWSDAGRFAALGWSWARRFETERSRTHDVMRSLVVMAGLLSESHESGKRILSLIKAPTPAGDSPRGSLPGPQV